jgi:ATP synthase protein I
MSTMLFASLAALRAAPTARAPRARRGASVRAAAGDGDPTPRDKAIWENKNVRMWDVDLEAEFERQERRKREEEERNRKEAASGLGFGNLAMLDDMSVDLSSQLRRKDSADDEDEDEDEDAPLAIGDGTPGAGAGASASASAPPAKKKKLPPGTRASVALEAIDAATSNKQVSKYDLDGWNYAPTRAEQARWQREWEKGEAIRASKNPVYAKSKFSTRQLKKLRPKDLKPTVGGRELTEAEKEERRRTADDAYLRVKQNLLLTTAGLCGSGTLGAFAVGGVPLGASFAFGSAGALFYVKLLASKAESRGGGQGGPPSILVPVILFMALNRWNTFFAPDVGIELAPIPMLLGFFTYKPASVFQAFRDILEEEQEEEEGAYDASR